MNINHAIPARSLKIFLLVIATMFASILLSVRAAGGDIASDAALPTDVFSPNGFSPNPAAEFPKTPTGSIGVWRRVDDHSLDDDGNQGGDVYFSTNHQDVAAVAMAPVDASVAAGLGLNLGSTTAAGNRSGGDQVAELMTSSEIALRTAMALSEFVRLGMMLRYRTIDANVAGGFGVSDNDRSIYHGSLLGITGGLAAIKGRVAFAILYEGPMRGKATVHSESKVLADSGAALISGGYQISPLVRAGLTLRQWFTTRDDRGRPSLAGNGQTNVYLAGTDFKRSLFPVHEFGLGGEYMFRPDLAGKAGLFQRQEEYLTDPDETPGKGANSNNRFDHWRQTIGLRWAHRGADISAGLLLSQAKHDFSGSGVSQQYKSNDRGFYTSLSSSF